jgi:peptide/nickel transport system ATP-binding protein
MRVQGEKNSDVWKKKALQTMDLVGLPARMFDQYPNQLSGGQRQRVAIARALINSPKIVICDEPTSALDVSVQSQILNLLNDLREELNLTYVIISHNLAVVEHMATQVAVMYFGEKVEEAETDQLFSNPQHSYTKTLLNSILSPDPRQRNKKN